MNDQKDENLAKATSEILSISEELSRLRGAVQEHSDAASALNKLSDNLGQLAQVMQKLPDPLASVTARGEQLVGSIEQALGPAATLASAVNSLSDSIANLPTEAMLRELFDVLQTKVENSSRETTSALVRMNEKFDDIAKSLKKLQSFSESQAAETVNGFSLMSREFSLTSEASATDQAKILDILLTNSKRLDDSIDFSKNHAVELSRKLDVIDRLARRSLFEILMGRDVEEKRV